MANPVDELRIFFRRLVHRLGIPWAEEFLLFGLKQGWACIFGAALLVGIVATKYWIYPHQANGWQLIGMDKWTAWFLLMQLSFVLIVALRELEQWLEKHVKSKSA